MNPFFFSVHCTRVNNNNNNTHDIKLYIRWVVIVCSADAMTVGGGGNKPL